MNLILNASDSLGEAGGLVSIATGAGDYDAASLREAYAEEPPGQGLYVHLEISDTGCGMTPEVRQRIFDPFFTTKFTGRGLGLAAVLGIVRGHHGAIRVCSEPGKGSSFTVLFPAARKHSAAHEMPALQAAPQRPPSHGQITPHTTGRPG